MTTAIKTARPKVEKMTRDEGRVFYRTLFKLGVPLALQQFVTSLINLLDTFMLGSVSEEVLTAAGLANKVFFIFSVIVYGINTGATIFMAQFYGKKDLKSIHKYLGIAAMFTMSAGALFTIIAIAAPAPLMSLFSNDQTVIAEGVKYLRFVAISYIPTALSICFYSALRSCNQTILPMIFTVVALCTNALFNSIFIFVLDMGIVGAAVATSIARVVELVALLVTLMIKKTALTAPIRNFFAFRGADILTYLKTAGLVILVELEWSLGTTLYTMAFKYYGTNAQAAVQVAETCVNLLNVLAIALGSAAAVMIGNLIGAGEEMLARKYARRMWFFSILFGAVIGVLMMGLSPVLPYIFPKLTAEGRAATVNCLLVMGAFMPVRCLEFLLMVGVLRSGGDTRVSILLDFIGVWVLTLPLMMLSTYVFHLPFIAVYLVMNAEMIFKVIAASLRMRSGKWLHRVV